MMYFWYQSSQQRTGNTSVPLVRVSCLYATVSSSRKLWMSLKGRFPYTFFPTISFQCSWNGRAREKCGMSSNPQLRAVSPLSLAARM